MFKNTTHKSTKKWSFASLFPLVILWLMCSEPVSVPQAVDFSDVVTTGFNGKYQYQTQQIVLQWNRLSNVELYKVSRYLDTLDNGEPLDAQDTILRVQPTDISPLVEFVDVPSLQYTDHFYVLAACKIINGDTLIGVPAQPIRVGVGKGVRFNINDGATKVDSKKCTLHLEDRKGIISKVSFTQVVNAQEIPVFDFSVTDDEANFVNRELSFQNQGVAKVHNIPWSLLPGKQDKKVYAQLNYFSGGVESFQPETVAVQVAVAPYAIKVKFEHEMQLINPKIADETDPDYRSGSSTATAILRTIIAPNVAPIDEYTINSKNVEFSVSVGGDNSMSRAFDCWIVMRADASDLFTANLGSSAPLLATAPQRFELTGSGKQHNEKHKYVYSIDPDSDQGKVNLRYLIPLGSNMLTNYPYVDAGLLDTATNRSVDANFTKIMSFIKDTDVGHRKPFLLVLKFVGTEFNDERYYFSSEHLLPGRVPISGVKERKRISFFDFYVPYIKLPNTNAPGYITNGDTLVNVLDFRLAPNESIQDKAFARVTKLEMVIAKKPADLIWNSKTWGPLTDVPQISIQTLLQNSYTTIPYKVTSPLITLNDVAWKPLDISSFPSGKYLIAIIASDEFGNQGFARMQYETSSNGHKTTNPFEVTVLSGK